MPRPEQLLLAALLALGACTPGAVGRPGAERAPDPRVREVTVRVVRPPPINLRDRGVETLGVVDFQGPYGAELARKLAAQVAAEGGFRVVPPTSMGERLMKAGLALGWEETGSALRWAHERAAVDAVLVGRVDAFRLEGLEEEKDTFTLQGTGEYGFTVTEEGKIAYREKMAYRRVPLICRSDRGVVAAAYRVWDARRVEVVATVHHHLSAEVPSFCYRGDVPERLMKQAQDRLLQRLFTRLNAQFLEEIVPRTERAEMAFEVLSGRGDALLVHRNELGILYASRGEWGQAVDMWKDCLLDRPDLPAAHYNLATAYRATGRLTLAQSHLNKALTLAPRPLYRRALGEVRTLLAAESGTAE